MNISDITLVVGIDAVHLNELRWTWPSWLRFKPEIRQMPLLVFYDPAQVQPDQAEFLHPHPQVRWVPWDWTGGWNQREKMITGWVHVPAREVTTTWYLKLDTDVIATGDGSWLKPEWFQPDAHGRDAVFISSRWNYTKPPEALRKLDDWGDTVPDLAQSPRLNLPFSPGQTRIPHRRIISWFFIGRTDWTRQAVGWLGPGIHLPHPSQDTFMFYCAKRGGQRMIRDRMGKYHWCHGRMRKIQALAHSLGISPIIRPL